MMPASAWGAAEQACAALTAGAGGGAPRLRVLGAGAAPPRLRLFARLAPRACTQRCRNQTRWLFYTSEYNLATCGFPDAML